MKRTETDREKPDRASKVRAYRKREWVTLLEEM